MKNRRDLGLKKDLQTVCDSLNIHVERTLNNHTLVPSYMFIQVVYLSCSIVIIHLIINSPV